MTKLIQFVLFSDRDLIHPEKSMREKAIEYCKCADMAAAVNSQL